MDDTAPKSAPTSAQDATEKFLADMPQLKPGQPFSFACHPGVPCFNACCSGLILTLTPYDALRLRTRLGKSSDEFIQDWAAGTPVPGVGFSLLRLRMLDDDRQSCPFVRDTGCSVYEDRPSACRTYPVGRGTKFTDHGLEERFFLIREGHCKGFEQPVEWTVESWTDDQGLKKYNRFNDRFTAIMSRLQETGSVLHPNQANMAFLALYQTDRFREFLEQMGVLERVDLAPGRAERIMEDEEERLLFGLDWMELLCFGACDGVTPKQPAEEAS